MLKSGTDTLKRVLPVNFWEDAISILKIALPVLLANFCNFGMMVTDTMYLGHLGEESFAAAALATTWSSCTFFLALGLVFGMDTLASQAAGAGNYELVGILLQNTLFLVTLAAVPVGMLWMFTEEIMSLLGQSAAIASKAGIFGQYLIPGLLPYLYFSCLQRYLTNQNIVMPSLIVGFVGFALNILFNYIFIYTFELGYIGSAVSTSVSLVLLSQSSFVSTKPTDDQSIRSHLIGQRILQPIMLWLYIYIKRLHVRTWFGWSREMWDIKRLKHYLTFGIGSGLMITFEICTIFAALLGSAATLNAHTIGFNSLLISFTIPLSISIGTSTRIGNFLGEGLPMRAKASALTGVILNLGIMAFNAAMIITFRKQFGKMYTEDSEVLDIVPNILILSGITCFLDGAQVLLGGILRGAGLPRVGTILNFVGYYCIALPCYGIFGYALKWGIYGIWTGLPLGLLVICIGLTIVVLRIDWIKESINARERSEKPGESVDMKTLHDEENAPLAVSQDTDDTSIALENDEPSIKT